jgi:hypothetical protein
MRFGLKCLWAVVLLFTCNAVAQSDYSIRSYDLRIEPDFVHHTVRVATTIVIDNPSLLTAFEFDLNPVYKVSIGKGNPGAQLKIVEGGIRVDLPHGSRQIRLELLSEGAPGKSSDEERAVIDPASLFLLWSDRWYPIDFDHWAPVRTTIVLPREFLAIAPGRIISNDLVDGKRTIVFEERNPAVAFSVIADRRWIEEEQTVSGFRIRTLLYPESRKWAPTIFATSPDVLNFFTELHGGYWFEQYGFVSVEGIYARRAFNGFVGYSPAYLDKEMGRTGYDAHETSLLWWGLTTRGSGPGSWQWTEGLGDYVETMYADARGKPLPPIFARFRDEYLALPADQDVAYTELQGNTPQEIVHGKYPWLMHVLRLGIGDEAFRRGIRDLFQQYQHRTFTMSEFIATFERSSGSSLAWWSEGWLEREGALVASFDSQAAPNHGSYWVRLKLTQQGAVRRVPAQIGIRTASGMRTYRVVFEADGSPTELESAELPLEVVFDPEHRLPVRITAEPKPH